MPTYKLSVNSQVQTVTTEANTPLLYVLRNDLELNGAKFGCGLAQCGACSVIVGGDAVRSCQYQIGSVGDREITTLEGLGTIENPHPLQTAFIEEQAMQCGYCISGMIMEAKVFLDRTKQPTESEIRTALDGHLCRCGSQNRIVRAVARAAKEMAV